MGYNKNYLYVNWNIAKDVFPSFISNIYSNFLTLNSIKICNF